mgnify:CR=1 FL=1
MFSALSVDSFVTVHRGDTLPYTNLIQYTEPAVPKRNGGLRCSRILPLTARCAQQVPRAGRNHSDQSSSSVMSSLSPSSVNCPLMLKLVELSVGSQESS